MQTYMLHMNSLGSTMSPVVLYTHHINTVANDHADAEADNNDDNAARLH